MPQLNPEFYISQLFWLLVCFSFLFIFLWRISLPRIGSVLEKRANKINDDIKIAKQYQAETEEIQIRIDNQLREAKIETTELIKSANQNLQDHSAIELEKVDKALNEKLEETSKIIEKNKVDSMGQINDQIYEITKLIVSKISNIEVNSNDIKETISKIDTKVIN